jgi:hypothetical protein
MTTEKEREFDKRIEILEHDKLTKDILLISIAVIIILTIGGIIIISKLGLI